MNEISDTDLLIREPQSSEELMLTPSLGEHFTSGNVHLPLVKRRGRPKEFKTLGCFNSSKGVKKAVKSRKEEKKSKKEVV